MSHRQQQHMGRDTEQEKDIAGRNRREDPEVSEETTEDVEAARNVSRAVERNEGQKRTE